MRFASPCASRLTCVVVVVVVVALATSGVGAFGQGAAAQATAIERARTEIEAARVACGARDPGVANVRLEAGLRALEEIAVEACDESCEALLVEIGGIAKRCTDPRLRVRAFERLIAVRERRLPANAPDLLVARCDLALGLVNLKEFEAARVLLEDVVAAWAAHPEPDLAASRRARYRLALTKRRLDDSRGARAVLDELIVECERADPPDLTNLAWAHFELGVLMYVDDDFRGARALQEPALAILETLLPADDPSLDNLRGNLAITLFEVGELPRARALQETVLANAERDLHEDSPALVSARRGLANTLALMGDLNRARELEEKVLATCERTPDLAGDTLAMARTNLGATLSQIGEYGQARVLQERVLAQREAALPNSHPLVLRARINLAGTLLSQGDLSESRNLSEGVVEILDRTLPEDHSLRVGVRANLARCYYSLGDYEKARDIQVGVLASRERTLPAGHPEVGKARLNLSNTLHRLGRGGEVLELREQILLELENSETNDEAYLAVARANLASSLLATGDFARARSLLDATLASPTIRNDATGLDSARPLELWCWLLAKEESSRTLDRGRPEAAREFEVATRALLAAERRIIGRLVLESSPREAEERMAARRPNVQTALELATGAGAFPPEPSLAAAAFLLAESSRTASLGVARIAAAARGDAAFDGLLRAAREASEQLVRRAQSAAGPEAVRAAQRALDIAQRELVLRGASRIETSSSSVEDLEGIVAQMGDGAALVSWMRCTRGSEFSEFVDVLVAHVLRGSADGPRLERFELGAMEEVKSAVERWRAVMRNGTERGIAPDAAVVDAGKIGDDLRARVLDPLIASLRGAKRVIAVVDDVLHTVPLDALPAGPFAAEADAATSPLGDVVRFEYRSSAFELLESRDRSASDADALVALGHPAFDSEPTDTPDLAPESPLVVEAGSARGAAFLRGGAFERGFAPLPATREEVRAIGQYFEDVFGEESPRHVLERRAASRQGLLKLAPRARWLHIASHGWFTPESVRSADEFDAEGTRAGKVESKVRGSSPMVLAGLALAGANRPADEVGRYVGLVTAQEIAAFDLSGCELAVLSACDTNVGVRRAGQGVASLQRALHMAGARTVITSLWKVPDEATKELMVDFYRRFWVQQKPKGQALWEAKRRLREVRDESGRALYATRDWAAWVLSGDPE